MPYALRRDALNPEISSPCRKTLPRVGLQLARDQIEVGCFARAVRSYDRRQRAMCESTGDAVHCNMAAELNGKVARFKRTVHVAACRSPGTPCLVFWRNNRAGMSQLFLNDPHDGQRLLRIGIFNSSAEMVRTRSRRS